MSTEMTLLPNQVLVDTESDDLAKFRICWLNQSRDLVSIIRIGGKRNYPCMVSMKEVLSKIEQGLLIFSERTYSSISTVKKPAHRTRAKTLYDRLKPFYERNVEALSIPGLRSRLIETHLEELGVSYPTVLKYLCRYFSEGMTIYCFFPRYKNCGAPGKEVQSDKKLGRPVLPENIGREGKVLSTEDKIYLQKCWKEFCPKPNVSQRLAYEQTLQKYYQEEVCSDIEIPSYSQFRYWGKKVMSLISLAVKKAMPFNLANNISPSYGSARHMGGPGAQAQMDATGGLVNIVAPEDRSRVIGKTHPYLMQDNYSSVITGWTWDLENPSNESMKQTLLCSLSPKENYFYGYEAQLREILRIPDSEPLMPPPIMFNELLSDNGSEFLSNESRRLVDELNYTHRLHPPREARKKPYIENLNGVLKIRLRRLPGASSKYRERQEKDPKVLAVLTLDELRFLLLLAILEYNHRPQKGLANHPDADAVIKAGYKSLSPINFWYYGLSARSGGRQPESVDLLRAKLLERKEVKPTSKGILVNGLYYYSPNLHALGESYRLPKLKSRRHLEVAFDPNDISQVWIINKEGRLGEKCLLAPRDQHHRGKTLWQLKEERKRINKNLTHSERDALAQRIGVNRCYEEMVASATEARNQNGQRSVYDAHARSEQQHAERKKRSMEKTHQPNNSDDTKTCHKTPITSSSRFYGSKKS